MNFLNSLWFRLLAGGTLLFFMAEQSLKITGNPNLIPTVILLGAFVVPVAFSAFIYQQERTVDGEIQPEAPLATAAYCFVAGGAIGVASAGFLEYQTLSKLNVSSIFAASFIEEISKLIFPVVIYLRSHYRSEADGLLFGVASGMGFAALETMGYGLVALVESGGNIGRLEEVLLIRGLASPVGHATWTGLVSATLWHQRERMKGLLNIHVVIIFGLVVTLHATWNLASFADSSFINYTGGILIGGMSLMLLLFKLRESRRQIR